MRVLHVISSLDPALGGPAAAILPMADALARVGGIEVTVAGGISGTEAPSRELTSRVELVLHPIPQRTSGFGRLELSPQLLSWLVRMSHHYDLVHTHGIFTIATSMIDSLRRVSRRPFVMRPCGALDAWSLNQGSRLKAPFLATITRPALRKAAFVHCTSESESDAVRRLEPSANARVIPHGLDLEVYRQAEPPKPPSRPYLLFLGRLHHKKGLDLLTQAFAAIAGGHPDLDLVVAGPDEGMQSTVERLSAEAGIASRVRIIGPVYGRKKVELMTQASVFVLPSHQENFGISAVEAAACGLPLVVSDGVAIHGKITASGAGVVTRLDSMELASALRTVLADRERFARGALQFAAGYSLENTARRLINLYEEALVGFPSL